MSAYLLLSPFDVEDDIAPHAELIRAQRPTASQVTEAAGILGLFPDGSYLVGELRVPPLPTP